MYIGAQHQVFSYHCVLLRLNISENVELNKKCLKTSPVAMFKLELFFFFNYMFHSDCDTLLTERCLVSRCLGTALACVCCETWHDEAVAVALVDPDRDGRPLGAQVFESDTN